MTHRVRLRRLRLAGIAAAIAAATLIPVATSDTAQAYTCSGARRVSLSDGTSSTSLTYYPKCSDGRAHWSGTVSDISCDNRAAAVALYADWYPGTYILWSHSYKAPNGCGTRASFSGSDVGQPRAFPYWKLLVEVRSCNFWGCSGGNSTLISR